MSIPVQPPKSTPAKNGMDRAAWAIIGVAVALIVILTLLPGGGKPQVAQTPASQTPGDIITREISMEGMHFIPDTVEVPAGTTLILEITNNDTKQHDLLLGDIRTQVIAPGDTVTQDFGVMDSSMEGWCTIAGHKSMGMLFTVVVTGSHEMIHEASAPAGFANTDVDVPTDAQRSVMHEGFHPRDPVLAPAPAGTVHEYEWTMTEEVRQVAPGHRQVVWLFDGQTPGPTLRGQVGDTFRITLHNAGTMDHSVDFHAGEVSPDSTMKTIPPGESLTYEFVAKRSGIWMYHCATAPMSLHIANGMAGAVIIDPPALTEVDEEYVLVAHEMFLGTEDQGANADRVGAGLYDLTAFNGYPNQYQLAPLEQRVGDTVRVWVMNVGPDNPISFHVVGEIFDTVFQEGQYLIRDAARDSTGSQALGLLAAQGGFVEFTFDEPGTYTFVNHQMTDAEKGQRGQFVVRQ